MRDSLEDREMESTLNLIIRENYTETDNISIYPPQVDRRDCTDLCYRFVCIQSCNNYQDREMQLDLLQMYGMLSVINLDEETRARQADILGRYYDGVLQSDMAPSSTSEEDEESDTEDDSAQQAPRLFHACHGRSDDGAGPSGGGGDGAGAAGRGGGENNGAGGASGYVE